MEVLTTVFFLISVVALAMLVTSLFNPHASIFYKIFRKTLTRKQIARRIAPIFAISFILMGIFAPPVKPELKQINLDKTQEVITETYKLEGEIKGKVESLKINDEEIPMQGSKFSKEINLQPGDNQIKVVATAEKDNKIYEVKNETYTVYFDYEGMLYAKEKEKEEQEEQELNEKLSTTPHYETVRKKDIQDGFTAVIYMDAEAEDYLLANLVKDFKSKNNAKNISVMIFKKSDKTAVEKVFESDDVNGLIPYVRANYEKRENNEQFFLFPTGLEGDKLAVEV